MLKQRFDEPGVRLKSQYSARLYQWAKQYVAVGYKRVSLAGEINKHSDINLELE